MVQFDVKGQIFKVSRDIIKKVPKLEKIVRDGSLHEVIVLDREP